MEKKKIASLNKRIKDLYEELDTKKKEIEDQKESVKYADEICRKNTAYAQKILVEKCSLAQEIKKKEEEIDDLKKRKDFQCKSGCEKYSKSMDEVMEYAEKNKHAAVRLKSAAEEQKKKLSILREEKTKMLDQLDMQEEELEEQNKLNVKLIDENKNAIKNNEELEMTVKDLKDENAAFSEKLKQLEKLSSHKEGNTESLFNSSGNSLEDELRLTDSVELQFKLKTSEQELEKTKENVHELEKRLVKKEEMSEIRLKYLKQLAEISDKRCKELDQLKMKVKSLNSSKTPKCKFGWKCMRGPVCHFDHVFLYSKVNQKDSLSETLKETVFLCDCCGAIFTTQSDYESHKQIHHEETNSNPACRNFGIQKDFKCNSCKKCFVRVMDLKNHEKRKHKENVSEENKCVKVNDKRKEDNSQEKSNLEKYCNNCDEKFKNIKALEDHRKTFHKEPKDYSVQYSCKQCSVSFSTQDDLKTHDGQNHKENITCIMYKKDLTNLIQMDSHMDEQHGGKWKLNDSDVLKEVDIDSESETEYEDSEHSKIEDSKSEIGEVLDIIEDCKQKGEM